MPEIPVEDPESRPPPNHNSQKTILVVEDQDEIGANMSSVLTLRGYHVVRAPDADGALTIAESDRPALILTDMELPTLDSMMQRIRGHETLKDILVAVIDMNHPLNVTDGVKILTNLEDLDRLLDGNHDQSP